MIIEGFAPIDRHARERNVGLFEVALHNLDNGLSTPPGRSLTGTANRQFAGAARVSLPHQALPHVSLEAALAARQSTRAYSGEPLSVDTLGALLQAAFGLSTAEVVPGVRRRSYPSGGGLFPVDAYIVVQRCRGLAPGFYYYDPGSHELASLRVVQPNLSEFAAEPPAPPGQPPHHMLVKASVAIVLTSWLQRSYAKYGERAWKLALLEAGHIGQNLYLAAAALGGVGVCALGGFNGPELEAALGLDGSHERALYPLVLGHLATEP